MSEYTEQAEQFLKDTGTTFTIEYQFTGPYFQGDKDKRDVYRFTLKNAKGEYSGTFGDSIRNTEDRATAAKYRVSSTWHPDSKVEDKIKAAIKRHKAQPKPSAYDILAGLEKYEPDTFNNWANELGYSEQPISEYPNVLKIWTSCVEQYRGLRKIFTEEQMEQLQEIA